MTESIRVSALLALAGLLVTMLPAMPAHAAGLGVDVPDVMAQPGTSDVAVPVTLTTGAADHLVAVVAVEDGHGTLSLDPDPDGDSAPDVGLEFGYDSFTNQTAIGFNGPRADVRDVLATLTWDAPNGDTAPSSPNLTVSVTQRATGVYYHGLNGHYYEYVADPGIGWTAARSAAEQSQLLGLQGYLVTITSAEENQFVANNTNATNIWIGASDGAVEGEWEWATGPADEQVVFSRGNDTPVVVDGQFASWSSGEPNDSNGEDYAVTNWNAPDGEWNDLAETNGEISGYLVEYGGLGTFTGEQATDTATLTATTPSVTVAGVSTGVDADGQVAVDVTGAEALGGTLVAVVSVDAGTLSVTDTTGLTLEYGYEGFVDQDRIGFHGTAGNVVDALEQHLTWHAPPTATDATVKVSLAEQLDTSGGAFYDPDVGTDGAAYEYVTTARTWGQADAATHTLEGATGHLATIADADENDFVAQHVQATDIWVGASDGASEGTWTWVDGTSVGTFGWASGEPNDYGTGEDCAVTNWRGSLGEWNDLACGGSHAYLVEYDVAAMTSLFSDADTGTASAAPALPSAPTDVRVDAAATELAVSWDAPADTGGGPLTGYTVAAEPGGRACTPTPATATTCTLAGLQAGTDYRVTVIASNAAGAGPASDVVTASPVDATVGDGGRPVAGPGRTTDVPIRVTLPADRAGKLNIPHGRLSRDASATDPTTVEVVVPPGLGPCIEVDTGHALVADGTVEVTLTDTVDAPMRATLVGPETDVARTLDDRAVWWNPDCDTTPDDASDAGGPVEASVDGDSATVDVSANHATARLAIPADGGRLVLDRVAHPQVTATTADDATLVLSGPTAALEDALATGVSWQAPHRPGLYELAVELAGDGGYATRLVDQLEVTGVPSAPRAVAATREGTTLVVTWQAPETTGSSPITTYDVTVGEDTCQVAGDDPHTCSIAGVTDAPVDVTVTATNAEGTSSPGTVTVAWPGAPRQVSAWAATSSTATVTWQEPADAGTATITGYTARNLADPDQSCTAGPTARECLVTWLDPGSTVTFEVLAHSAAGDSDPASSNPLRLVQADVNDGSDPQVDVGDTAPVALPIVVDLPAGFGDGTADDGTVTAELALPDGAGTLQVDEARLGGAILDPDRSDETTAVLSGTPADVEAALAAAVTWMPGPRADTHRLEADIEEDGGTLATRVGSWLRITGPPSPPAAPDATRTGTTVTATWQPPVHDGGSAPASYTATIGSDSCTVAAPARTCQLTGIPTGSRVTVALTTTNADGFSSNPATVVLPGTGGGGQSEQPADPVRDDEGNLPSPPPGRSETTVDGAPADVTVEGDGDSVTVRGDGFELDAQPVTGDGQPANSVVDARIQVPSTGGVRVQTAGFRPRSRVTVWLFSEPRLLGTLEVKRDGTLEDALLLLPDDVFACSHTLQVVGTTGAGRQVAVSLGIQVVADPFPFGDADPTGVHGPAIGCLASRGIVQGYTGGPYRPSRQTVRGEAAAMLARILGLDTTGSSAFPDTDGLHAGAIAALAEAGVAAGHADGTFRPTAALSRGELAALVVRAAALDPTPAADVPFPDVDGGPLAEAIATAAANGLVAGYGDGTFRPAAPVTRGEAATMLERLVVRRDDG